MLHACCHNPTGCDLSAGAVGAGGQRLQAAGGLVPFLDMAYQGFGDGIAEDGAAVRCFLASRQRFFVSTSFSKSFSLYGERVGALSVVCAQRRRSARVLSQLKIVIRTNYSTPPTFGATVVATVLTTPALRALWEAELAGMRERIRAMRHATGGQAAGRRRGGDLDYITQQKGMFSYSGLSRGADAAAAQPSSASTASIRAASASRRSTADNIDAVAEALARGHVARRRHADSLPTVPACGLSGSCRSQCQPASAQAHGKPGVFSPTFACRARNRRASGCIFAACIPATAVCFCNGSARRHVVQSARPPG